MKPLTAALNTLQGCYNGSLLAMLEILMSNTLALENCFSGMTAWYPNVILQLRFF